MKWQPIETAPKPEGNFPLSATESVLLFIDGGIYIGFWNGKSWDDGDWHDNIGNPTHWMPLPEPPEGDE